MSRLTKIAAAVVVLSGTASAALACELPPLVAIPAKDAVGDKGPQIQAETSKYFEAMKVYTACVQTELTTAGGDSAQSVVKAVLVQRNNSAVAEVQAVLKAFNDSVGGTAPAGAPEAGRRRDR